MRVGNFNLDDNAVMVAKMKFEKHRGGAYKKINASFEEFLNLFSSDCNSFANIGKTFDVSREAIRLIYQKYFTHLFPNRSNGRFRQRICTLKRRKLKAKTLPTDGLLREIANLALKNNFTVERILRKIDGGGYKFATKWVKINRKKCKIAHIKHIFKLSTNVNRSYSRVQPTISVLKGFDFLIVAQDVAGYPKRYFIIPTLEILRGYENKNSRYLYIPIEKTQGKKPKIDFWKYEDAWSLLGD